MLTLSRTLGDELRAARNRSQLTRPDVLSRLTSPISESTLATYEYGSRPLSVLAELCEMRTADLVSALREMT